MQTIEIETFYPKNQAEWRQWLQENHESKQSVWLVKYNMKSDKPSITWSQSVDEALCFGWIDSKQISIDTETSHQFFCKRKAKSTWSKINKNKVDQLIASGLMATAGFASIELAKQNGSWTIIDNVEELIIPTDLENEFEKKPCSKEFFLSLSKSIKKGILQWVILAKRPETRQKRIVEIVELAAQKLKPKLF